MSFLDGIPGRPNPESGFGMDDYCDWLEGLDIPSEEDIRREMDEEEESE